MSTKTTVRAGIYARISLDDAGLKLGVARQVEDCTTKAEAQGWTVAEVYEDNDVSATKGKPRPAYQRLVGDIKSGKINGVVVYAIDRLTRQTRELEDFIELVETHNVALANVAGELDLSTEYGQFTARMLGNLARLEAQRLGVRVALLTSTHDSRGW